MPSPPQGTDVKLSICAALACSAALATGCATQPDPNAQSSAQAAASLEVAQMQSLSPPALVSRTAPQNDEAPAETQVARYTTVSTRPPDADANPMAVIAKVHFPRQVVKTVGDAVRYLLIRTGYQVVPADTLDPRVALVFALPLPDNQRVLGPYRVDSMLGVLMGRPYQLVTDPAARTVTYTTAAAGRPVEQPASSPAATRSTPTAAARSVSLAQTRQP